MAPPLFILAVIVYVVSATAVKALVFDVPSGSSKCLTEELHRRAVSHASYRVVAESTSAADRRILVRVTGPRGEELYMAEGGERGEFRFEAAEDGEHTACFWSPRYERGAVVSVDVHWATTSVGAHARVSGSPPAVAVANEGRIATIAGELKKLEDSARLIHQEMLSFRQSELEMQRLNEDTATRLHSFTLLSLAMCVGVAALQLWHLKTFFQKQHIL